MEQATIAADMRQIDEEAKTIRERLMSASKTADLQEFSTSWSEANLVWCLGGQAGGTGDLALPGRLRGAFGVALMANLSAEEREGVLCPRNPPCAFDVLFRKHGRMDVGFELPSPWIIEADACGSDLLVRLRLFGFACDYATAAADAMARALQTIWLRSDDFSAHQTMVCQSLPAESANGALALHFMTPVLLTSANVTKQPRSLVTSLAARIAGLARWHDLSLKLDRAALVATLGDLTFSWIRPRRVRWRRHSSRQNRVIPMSGILGTLTLSGPSDALSLARLLLRFGSRCHIGADVAFGCGRFAVELVDCGAQA
jgi:hypothetical protein